MRLRLYGEREGERYGDIEGGVQPRERGRRIKKKCAMLGVDSSRILLDSQLAVQK